MVSIYNYNRSQSDLVQAFPPFRSSIEGFSVQLSIHTRSRLEFKDSPSSCSVEPAAEVGFQNSHRPLASTVGWG